jgi:hypothetical protein
VQELLAHALRHLRAARRIVGLCRRGVYRGEYAEQHSCEHTPKLRYRLPHGLPPAPASLRHNSRSNIAPETLKAITA